jgi:hypothetical protein
MSRIEGGTADEFQLSRAQSAAATIFQSQAEEIARLRQQQVGTK